MIEGFFAMGGPMMFNNISYLLDLEWVSTDSSGFFFFLSFCYIINSISQ